MTVGSWTLFSGYEPEGDNEDSSKFQCISLGVALNFDNSLLAFIDEQPLCAFERNLDTGKFEKSMITIGRRT
ncbi:DUF2185 domain-containing protein [Paenibacillus cellulosilyticus]|uniref:immunity protein Imm33 domain-containing protein n=1 Tax=Paenibacillus cellulosilyticus TaxID=375489 RepID=UPI000D71D03B|nr:DUF2185 domain-containing protein [Paenibacillus cellulosilyticus]